MKKKINKSEQIRVMVAQNPTAKAPEILALLKKDGVAVTLPLIYQALKKNGSPKTATIVKRGRKAAATALPSSTEDLVAAMRAFVKAAGGLDRAIEILSVVKK